MDEPKSGETSSGQPVTNYPDDPFAGSDPAVTALVKAGAGGGSRTPPPPPPEEPDEEDGMLRMSFLGHLEELRSRIIRMLMGLGVAFVLCVGFAPDLWKVVSAPAMDALTKIGIKDPHLVIIEPMENFSIIWVKLPLVVSLFVASPWVLYQIWAFIAPGLYKRERRWAVPFVLTTAGLFISGGLFAYFIAFRYGLAFLLGIGLSGGVQPMVTITNYFDLFVDVMLGVALVFELPVVIFFLTLLRLASPTWLLQHSRYAILAIVIIAAIVTPTPDVFNLMLFALPMCLLYFVGVFAGFLLVMKREGRSFPWAKVLLWTFLALAVIAAAAFLAATHYHLHLVRHWPFLGR
jgi:sec-independent protein translocase protein TatC